MPLHALTTTCFSMLQRAFTSCSDYHMLLYAAICYMLYAICCNNFFMLSLLHAARSISAGSASSFNACIHPSISAIIILQSLQSSVFNLCNHPSISAGSASSFQPPYQSHLSLLRGLLQVGTFDSEHSASTACRFM